MKIVKDCNRILRVEKGSLSNRDRRHQGIECRGWRELRLRACWVVDFEISNSGDEFVVSIVVIEFCSGI